MLPDFDRVDRIGSYWGNPKTRTFAELLIDCEEDRTPPSGARRDAAGGRPLVAWWEWALVFAGFMATVVLIARIVSRSRGDDWWMS